MRRVVKKNGRDKAFIGAIVGTVAGIAGAAISAKKQKKAQELAFKEAQQEQSRMEGVQQAAAMTSTYANQDYVNAYQDKITLKNGGKVKVKDRIGRHKQFAIGGRKKNNMGSNEDENANIAKTISSIGQGVGNGINMANSLNTNALGDITPTVLSGLDSVISNRKIATDATASRFTNNKLDVTPVNTKNKITAEYGVSLGTDVAGAAGGVGGLIGSLFSKPKAPKTIKKADGFSFAAPKTGMIENSYQVDANGNPITALNVPTAPVNPNTAINPAYVDRLEQAGMGKRKKVKSK